jgi:hypothetical protein
MSSEVTRPAPVRVSAGSGMRAIGDTIAASGAAGNG